MNFQTCYKRYEEGIGNLFAKYGTFVSNYPIYIMTGCILVNFLLGIGLIRIESEGDVETLYTPMNSKATEDRSTVKQLFEDKTGTNFYSKSLSDLGSYGDVIVMSKNGESILDTKYFSEIQNIHNEISAAITFRDNGQAYSFTDVCALRNGTCIVTGDVFLSTDFQMMASASNISYPVFDTEVISTIFGNISTSNNLLNSASMIKLRYNLRQDTEVARKLSKKWKTEFIDRLLLVNRSLTEFAYATSESLNNELDKATQGDIIYFSLTFTLMITYASLATIGGDCISDRSHIGRAGVVATILAILGSFGLVSAWGVKFVNIVGVMPFLIIGIGIDDMFILMSGLADAASMENIKNKMQFTMRSSGVAITITSVTDFIAFGIGATSPFYSVRNFCIYTGIAVIFCYINQLTFTMPCLVLHERRAASKRSCATCLPIRSRAELKKDEKSKCYVFCCGGTPAKERDDTANPMEKFPIKAIQRLVLFKPMKVIILILFTVYLCASIWGTVNLEQGLDLSNLVSDDSYFRRYSVVDRDHFNTEVLVSFVIPSEQTYSDSTTQSSIEAILTKAKSDFDIQSSFEINWLSEFKSSAFFVSSSETALVTKLAQFLNFRPDLSNDVVLDSTGTKVVASRFYVISENLKTSTAQGRFMQNMRSIAETSELSAISYAPPFIFFEQYVQILPNTLQTLGIAIGAMLVVTTIFMPHPFIIGLVTLTLVMICLGISGFMYFWGLTLSSVTMIHIIMSVGFSVDFSAHICHAFLTVEGTNRNAKVAAAIIRSGGPVFNATISSVLGILMLLLSESYIFQSFFKLMFLVIVFGLAHSMLLLPVILSLFGPLSMRDRNEIPPKYDSSVSPSPAIFSNRTNAQVFTTSVNNELDQGIALERGQNANKQNVSRPGSSERAKPFNFLHSYKYNRPSVNNDIHNSGHYIYDGLDGILSPSSLPSTAMKYTEKGWEKIKLPD